MSVNTRLMIDYWETARSVAHFQIDAFIDSQIRNLRSIESTKNTEQLHWTKQLGVTYDTPVDGEPSQCPNCGSKKIGRTPEVISLYRSPLMCMICGHTFGGNLPPVNPINPSP